MTKANLGIFKTNIEEPFKAQVTFHEQINNRFPKNASMGSDIGIILIDMTKDYRSTVRDIQLTVENLHVERSEDYPIFILGCEPENELNIALSE